MHALLLAGEILTVPALVAAVVSVVVRYRRADDVARQQIKWLAVAGVFTLCSSLVGAAIALLGPPAVGYTLILLGMIAIPIAIGVAILRHRLYDVDRVISRSLIYGALTLLLGAAYAGLVLGGPGGVLVVRGRLEPRDRGLDARRRRAVPAGALARAAASSTGASTGAATTPQRTLEAFGARLRRASSTSSARRRPERRRRRDDAARARLALAPRGARP